MPMSNSASHYGGVTKSFHWLTALLILTLIPLGSYANCLPYETDAELAHKAGLDGIVCSGKEVGKVHAEWKDGFFVVPGLRPAGSGTGDQKRVVTPRAARDNGARVLVIGRPISRADDPEAAARAIEATL